MVYYVDNWFSSFSLIVMPKILIVDDEKPLRDMLAKWFAPVYTCFTAPDATEALRLVRANPDLAVMISDVKMPGESGVELLRKAKAENPSLAVILLTAYGTVDLAVEAMKDGATDFFQKPITDMQAFERRVAKALQASDLDREVTQLKDRLGTELERFTGRSPAMQRVYTLIRKVAPSGATILIEGPSGSGKELAAQAIHRLSKRAKGPFIAVECAAFSGDLLKSELFGYEPGTFTGGLKDGKKGCIEEADGGTLFLDEIGEIDLPTQIALLRTIETKSVRRLGGAAEEPVDFRLVAATNRNLAKMVADGTFREDLYYRLNVIDVRMPALKDHAEDIAPLVRRFLKEFSAANGGTVTDIEPAALKVLEGYAWPGNVRQLRNAVEKMVVLASGPQLTVADLPADVTATERAEDTRRETRDEGENERQETPDARDGREAGDASGEPSSRAETATISPLAETEKAQILSALEKCRNNKSKAADLLGISRRTLHRKLKEWGLA